MSLVEQQASTTIATHSFRIDVHHHVFPPAFLSEQGKLNPAWYPQKPPAMVKDWTPQTAINEMDRNSIAGSIVSMSTAPGLWFGDKRAACRLARVWNEYAAQLARDYPGRFGFFAAMPLLDIDGTLEEITYALDVLKADGIQLITDYDGLYPGDPLFRPVLEELNRRKAVAIVHPTVPPACLNMIPDVLPRTVEFVFDSTRAIVSLVLSGVTSQLPDIRFIFCHGGGTLPMLAGRIEELTKNEKGRDERIPRGIEFELKKLYYETANAYHLPAYAALRTFAPIERILFGTDFPYVTSATNCAGLNRAEPSDDLKMKIERSNALTLFRRFAASGVTGRVLA
jgi:predicted TIM-barrel fold metal-dependent hydrolase